MASEVTVGLLGFGLMGQHTARALVAMGYGFFAEGSIWYPINLVASSLLPSINQADLAQLTAFNPTAFILALIKGTLTVRSTYAIFLDTALTSAMIGVKSAEADMRWT